MITRTLLSGRWLLRSALALVAILLCVFAATWQWDRSQQQLAAEQAALAEPAPVGEVVSPADPSVPIEALGRQVTVTGEYLAGAQSIVRTRLSPGGEPGFWVVNGVRTSDGTIVSVLRGWSPSSNPTTAEGSASVVGRLQPDENFYGDALVSAARPLVTITQAGLREQWEQPSTRVGQQVPMTPGFVAATQIRPGDPDLESLIPLIGTDPEIDYPLRNVFYSLQWLVFAGFVIVVWLKWFREDVAEASSDGHEDAGSRERVRSG